MTERSLIVVDIETTGLGLLVKILEVAAVNVHTGEEMYFAPHIDRQDLVDADPDALRINRYYERAVYRDMLSPNDTDIKYMNLQSMLRGHTFGGSNPTFDAERISRVTWNTAKCLKVGHVWHHRLADLAAYAAGVLGLPPTELPGLAAVCKHLNVDNESEHSALADARATAECFKKLLRKGDPAWSLPQRIREAAYTLEELGKLYGYRHPYEAGWSPQELHDEARTLEKSAPNTNWDNCAGHVYSEDGK